MKLTPQAEAFFTELSKIALMEEKNVRPGTPITGSLEEMKAKLQPGDILITKPSSGAPFPDRLWGSVVGNYFKVRGKPFGGTHAALYLGDGKVLHQYDKKLSRFGKDVVDTDQRVQTMDLSIFKKMDRDILAVRTKLPQEQLQHVLNRAKSMKGALPYNMSDYWRAAFLPAGPERDSLRDRPTSGVCTSIPGYSFGPYMHFHPEKSIKHIAPADIASHPDVDHVIAYSKDTPQPQVKAAESEFAPGIPQGKPIHPLPTLEEGNSRRWNLAVQHHPALKSGDHHDIRLVDPETGHAHSWATKRSFPKPGDEPVELFQQPTHTSQYALGFSGPIEKGYGATRPGTGVSHVIKSPIEVIRSKPDHLRFNLHGGAKEGSQEFVVSKTKSGKWWLLNVTKTQAKVPIQFEKGQYKEIPTHQVDTSDDNQIMTAKIDGAHNYFVLRPGSRPRVYSYREPKNREAGILEHSHKFPDLYGSRVPSEVGDTIVRGEVYAKKDGKAIPAEQVAGMLNSSTDKSLESQKGLGGLRVALFDVVKFQGQPFHRKGYAEKLEALQHIQKHMPQFEMPEAAHTKEEKEALLKQIGSGELGSTREGVVLWHKTEPLAPIKAKFKSDHDVYVREIERATDKNGNPKNEMGAFKYSLTPDGPILGRIGTGFHSAQKRDMWERPDVYVGAAAKIKAERQHSSGAFAKGVFQEWHPDKSPHDFWSKNPVGRSGEMESKKTAELAGFLDELFKIAVPVAPAPAPQLTPQEQEARVRNRVALGVGAAAAATPFLGLIGQKKIIHDPFNGGGGQKFKTLKELAGAAMPGDVMITSKPRGSMWKLPQQLMTGTPFYHAQPVIGRRGGVGTTASAGEFGHPSWFGHTISKMMKRISPVNEAMHGEYPDVMLLRPKNMTSEQIKAFQTDAMKNVTSEYSGGTAVKSWLHDVFVPKIKAFSGKSIDPSSWDCSDNICSTVPAKSFEIATGGKRVMDNLPSNRTMPVDFLRSDQYEVVGSRLSGHVPSAFMQKAAPYLSRAALGLGLGAAAYGVTKDPMALSVPVGAAAGLHLAGNFLNDDRNQKAIKSVLKKLNLGKGMTHSLEDFIHSPVGTLPAGILGAAAAYGGAKGLQALYRRATRPSLPPPPSGDPNTQLATGATGT